VGRDQKQHVEMARDIAGRFNHHYGDLFTLPEAVIDESTAVLLGLDGRKMSKSYDNTIPLFAPEKRLRKLIMRIKTNSLEPGEPKDAETCTLFAIYRAFASSAETAVMAQRYREGIGWGEMKNLLFEYLNAQLAPYRAEYDRLLSAPDHVESILQTGARRAREISEPLMNRVRHAVGIRPLARG
jgi:tryptophanyl-tRNA synthetase